MFTVIWGEAFLTDSRIYLSTQRLKWGNAALHGSCVWWVDNYDELLPQAALNSQGYSYLSNRFFFPACLQIHFWWVIPSTLWHFHKLTQLGFPCYRMSLTGCTTLYPHKSLHSVQHHQSLFHTSQRMSLTFPCQQNDGLTLQKEIDEWNNFTSMLT